ncbi:MAG TPA: hypothetical protein PKD85_04950, partial [Saprospiraceae bacterium]|nr:hypothetical protein [Saprospiraceae bacterium]
MSRIFFKVGFCLSLIWLSLSDVFAQSMDTPFGKNRIQYHDNFRYWDKYESDNFIVYWYGRNRYLGQAAVQIAEMDHDEIRKIIEHRINDKIEIIVYTDLHDLKQSNIGVEDAFHNKAGETKIAGNKMFVYFDGNHQNLRRSIREGIASVYLGALMLGNNFQEILQSSVLEDLPEWYSKGVVSFAGDYWNIHIEDELRDVLERHPKLWKWKRISEKFPGLAGHSFWNYISQQYGRSSISNIIYLTKISRDVRGSFEFVLNVSYAKIIADWEEYYRQLFDLETNKFDAFKKDEMLRVKNKKYHIITQLKVNPLNSHLAYISNNLGKVQLRVKNLSTEEDSKIWGRGYKNAFQQTDFLYPTLCWHPTNEELSFVVVEGKYINLYRYNLRDKKIQSQKFPLAFQRVYSICYLDDRYYIISASIEGVSDLFLYDTRGREFLNITADYYDDLDAHYTTLNGEKGILFSSNRTQDHILPNKLDTLLPTNNFDLFFYPLSGPLDQFGLRDAPKAVERLTYTVGENERFPILFKKGQSFLFLSGQSGIVNAYYKANIEADPQPVSNFSRNIIAHSISEDGQDYYYTVYDQGKYSVFKTKLDYANPRIQHFTEQKRLTNELLQQYMTGKENTPTTKREYTFQSKYKDTENVKDIREADLKPIVSTQSESSLPDISSRSAVPFSNTQVTAAGLVFRFHDVTTKMDNSVLFEGLELFGGQNPQVNQIPMGFLAKASVSDLFEDHKLEGGIRVPSRFNGSEFFVTYDNNKQRIDRRLALYRRVLTEARPFDLAQNEPFRSGKEQILGMYQLKYPLSVHASVRGISSLRFDRNFIKAQNEVSFESPIEREKRVGLRFEYVFDNTYNYSLNLMHGSRMKVYLEGMHQFEFDFIDGFNIDLNKGFTGILGVDARHYVQILQHSVLALRGASALSFGSKPNLYYLGGANNQLFNSFDQSTPTGNRDFAFQTNANHMRGFRNNIRNGTSFALINTEFRIPIFKYLLGNNRGGSFIRNLQVVGFSDLGLAWYGLGPNSSDNPINTERVV